MFEDGRVLCGTWERDSPTLDCIMTFSGENSAVYKGKFTKDYKPHGRGTMDWTTTGERYNGLFERGKIQGHGRWDYADGSFYLGEFQNGQPHGMGKRVASDGSMIHDGCWSYGAPVIRNQRDSSNHARTKPRRKIGKLLSKNIPRGAGIIKQFSKKLHLRPAKTEIG